MYQSPTLANADAYSLVPLSLRRPLLAPNPQLLAPQLGRNFLDRAFQKVPQVERPVLHADQPRDLQPQPLHQPLDLAVLAFLQPDADPRIHALGALQVSDHRAVFHAVDGDADRELVEIGFRHLSQQPRPIGPRPAPRGE